MTDPKLEAAPGGKMNPLWLAVPLFAVMAWSQNINPDTSPDREDDILILDPSDLTDSITLTGTSMKTWVDPWSMSLEEACRLFER